MAAIGAHGAHEGSPVASTAWKIAQLDSFFWKVPFSLLKFSTGCCAYLLSQAALCQRFHVLAAAYQDSHQQQITVQVQVRSC